MHILLLERDPLYRDMTHEMLQRNGKTVCAAETERMALGVLQAGGVGMVLTDGQPGSYPCLRAQAWAVGVPMVRLQDWGDPADGAGAVDGPEVRLVLHKPFTERQLCAAVRRVISLFCVYHPSAGSRRAHPLNPLD